MNFQRISVERTKEILAASSATIIDVRDPHSFAAGHIENAIQLDDQTIAPFLAATDKSTPLIIYCYHGNTSQGAADYFASHGFTQVYSMDGGFEEWR